jgi:hypothetical protein
MLQSVEVGAESVPEPVVVPAAPAAPVGPRLVSVGVRNRCPWATIQSAGASWGREPMLIRADDPRLPELRRCQWLVVTPVD